MNRGKILHGIIMTLAVVISLGLVWRYLPKVGVTGLFPLLLPFTVWAVCREMSGWYWLIWLPVYLVTFFVTGVYGLEVLLNVGSLVFWVWIAVIPNAIFALVCQGLSLFQGRRENVPGQCSAAHWATWQILYWSWAWIG
ncbi:MAG: hypothetical protein AXA67_08810 [Methylothermaceae bacteria B42]|nr:MAG: hypothetical protein AXA67_08810 [Methylothermaceae bacteria B42]HHJ39405.1 hypothetical protein [Methylothermaceae bacterium]